MEDRNGGACEGWRGRQACGGYAGGPGIPMLRDPSVGGASGKALRAPPAGGLLENDRAERSGFVETVFIKELRTVSGAPRPFPSAQREIA